MTNQKSERKTGYLVSLAALLMMVIAVGVYSHSKWDEWTLWPQLRKPMVDGLKDPDSAQFRNQFPGRQSLCGEINARNGLGGYTGFSRFISTGQRYILEGSDVNTWSRSDDGTAMFIAKLDREIELMRALNRTPTEQELHAAFFKHLWSERCEGLP